MRVSLTLKFPDFMNEKAINITSAMLAARKGMRDLFGNKYQERIEPYKKHLQLLEAKGLPTLKGCMETLASMQKRGVNGTQQGLLLAATVELIEHPIQKETA